MKHLISMLVLVAAVIMTPSVLDQGAQARQSDSRLDALFARLQVTENPAEAGGVEAMIWSIWTAADDAAIDEMMAAGIEAMNTSRFSLALKSFDEVVAADPDFAEGWNKRATLYYLMGRYEDSIADVNRTLALEPRHFGALAGLGLIYTALDDAENALDAFERALEVNPYLSGIALRAAILRKMLQGEPI